VFGRCFVALISAAILASCVGGPTEHRWAGIVSSVKPFCVARHAATGACFKSDPSQILRYNKGECVEITVTEIAHSDALTLTAVRLADAAEHPSDCPDAAD
jgi:hypothetical protein